MNRAPSVVAISAAYLSLGSLALYAWLWHTTPALPSYVALVCALPLALCLLVTSTRTLPARERILRSLVCFMFLPILLLMWGSSADFASTNDASPARGSARSALPSDTLRDDVLFTGALARQDIPKLAGVSFSGSGAVFPDGSELRVSRFASAREAEGHLKQLADTFHASASTLGARTGMSAKPSADLLVYWELHGASVLELRAGSEAQARARLSAQNVPLPPAQHALPAAESAAPEPVGPWLALSAALGHAIAFCLFLFWSAAATTRVAAQPAGARLSARSMLAQIEALPQLGARCRVLPGETEHERVIALLPGLVAGRAHRLTLRSDEAGRVVRVVEVERAEGVAPQSSDEASMRAVGDTSFAPNRPRAARVWGRKRQVTIIEPERLQSLPLSYEQGRPQLPAGFAEKLDADGIVHLVCALVTAAGFDYQPVLFLFQGGSAAKP
jgi:hypothetical protein